MKLVVGLGNPEERYIKTRHNIGYRAIEKLAEELDIPTWTHSKNLQGFYCKKDFNGEEIELVKPTTYMNLSGKAVAYALKKHPEALAPENIIIIHDDLDLPLGKIQVRKGGAAAGHHGVESVIKYLGSDDFVRIRVGIGPAIGAPEKFVLEKFTKEQEPEVKKIIVDIAEAVLMLLKEGMEKTQNRFN